MGCSDIEVGVLPICGRALDSGHLLYSLSRSSGPAYNTGMNAGWMQASYFLTEVEDRGAGRAQNVLV